MSTHGVVIPLLFVTLWFHRPPTHGTYSNAIVQRMWRTNRYYFYRQESAVGQLATIESCDSIADLIIELLNVFPTSQLQVALHWNRIRIPTVHITQQIHWICIRSLVVCGCLGSWFSVRVTDFLCVVWVYWILCISLGHDILDRKLLCFVQTT